MNRRMILMLLMAGTLFGGIFGYKAFIDRIIAQVFDTMEPDAVTISTSIVREMHWAPRTEAVGTFRAIDGADLSVELGGIVRTIHFRSGQPVDAGQPLVSLDTETDQAELARLQAAERLAELELDRQQRLFREASTSRADLERAESEAAQARAARATQQARINQKTVRAPFAGVTGIRKVNPGQYLSPGTAVVSLQSLDPIYLDFSLPQRLLPLLEQPGVRLAAIVDAYPGQRFAGEISAMEPRLSATTRTVAVQATLSNPDHRLRPGMFARVALELGDARPLAVVPQTAIRFSTYGDSVFVVEGDGEDHHVIQRFVRTGDRRGDLIAIEDGLRVGEEVANSGLLKLQNMTRVRIDNDEATRPSEDVDPRPTNR